MITGRMMHSLVFAGLILVASAAVAVAADPSFEVQVVVLSALVVALGLPHGALDLPIARAHGLVPTRMALLAFIAGYLALAAAVIAIWSLFPAVALAAFLVVSAAHFGGDWGDVLSRWQRPLAGGMVLGIPAAAHPEAVASIFQWLVPETAAGPLAALLGIAGIGAFAALALSMVFLRAETAAFRRACLELGAVVVASVLLPPLLAFASYFCILHSPRHLIDQSVALGLNNLRTILAATLPLTLVTAAVAGAAHPFFATPASEGVWTGSLLSVIFIGLAALTVPHMLLVDFMVRQDDGALTGGGSRDATAAADG